APGHYGISLSVYILNTHVSKCCAGLSTCVLGKLSQDTHKLQTFPHTNVGAGTPGKKRSLSEQYENYGSSYS
uniref:Calcitonin peptide-like domain-containing protein n=1 Tax=Monopterus albus TaxID=43700 RepID=A0A3Q3K3Z7_MONAL